MACCHWPWMQLWETTDCNYQEGLVHCISVSSRQDTAFQSQGCFQECGFAFSFVNTDISHSPTLTPRAFRMHVISVWLTSLKTVLTLLERRQYMNPRNKDNVVSNNDGYEKVRWEERELKINPLIIHMCCLRYLSMNLSTADMILKRGIWACW